MKKLMKKGRNMAKAAVATAGMVAISGANAAIPVEVSTALADATTDVTSLGGLALLLAGAGFAIFALYRRVPRG